jgi:hypothetical protein
MRHHPIKTGLLASTLLAAALAVASTGPATAAGATRFFVPEDYDGTGHVSAADNPCGPWAATMHEIRHGGYDVLLPPGGQVAGEAHINGSVDGWLQLTPDDPSLPTYTGSYREKGAGVLTDPDHDQFRTSHFSLRDRLTGSDGSTLTLVLSEKVTVNARGDVVVDRSVETCG